jgi:hypothetical protein
VEMRLALRSSGWALLAGAVCSGMAKCRRDRSFSPCCIDQCRWRASRRWSLHRSFAGPGTWVATKVQAVHPLQGSDCVAGFQTWECTVVEPLSTMAARMTGCLTGHLARPSARHRSVLYPLVAVTGAASGNCPRAAQETRRSVRGLQRARTTFCANIERDALTYHAQDVLRHGPASGRGRRHFPEKHDVWKGGSGSAVGTCPFRRWDPCSIGTGSVPVGAG